MTEPVERYRRKRKLGNNVLSLYLIQCLDGTRPASEMPYVDCDESFDLMPQFAKIKKPNEDDTSKSKFSYGNPAQASIVRSQGAYLYDRQGNSYLDSVSGVSHIGHCHPRVTQTAQLQLARYGTGVPLFQQCDSGASGNYGNSRYSERLLKTLPKELNSILFFTSGSEANDVAIQMARAFTGNYDVVVFEEGFHGSLGLVSDVSHKIVYRSGGTIKPWVHVLPIPDTYRGPYLASDPDAFDKYFEDAKAILDQVVNEGRKIACLLTEPIFTFHSVLIPPMKYFQQICDYIRKLGGLIIIDEVQTGLGRMGEYTWAFEMHEIIPDIITTGKPLGNGHPLAVTITTKEIVNSLGLLGTMYEPTTAQEAIGNTVLDIMANEDLQNNAYDVGKYLIDTVTKMMQVHPFIAGVYGMGLLIGIEFVWDRESKSPAKEVAQAILYQMRENHIITAVEGKYQNIVFLIPPLCFSKDDAKKFTNALAAILDDVESLGKDALCEKLAQGSERYSSWNNIPEDYLSACNPHRGERQIPAFDQQTSNYGHVVEIEAENESLGEENDDTDSNADDNDSNEYDQLD